MDPIASKFSTLLPGQPCTDAAPQPPRAGSSRFDQVKNRLAGSSDVSTAATEAQRVADNQKGVGKEQGGMTVTPSSRVQNGLAVGQHHLDRLKERVGSMQSSGNARDIESRLIRVEQQYTRLDSAVKALPSNASPQQWIALQQQVYSMNENINALSKLVGQAASGVKTIVQTQV